MQAVPFPAGGRAMHCSISVWLGPAATCVVGEGRDGILCRLVISKQLNLVPPPPRGALVGPQLAPPSHLEPKGRPTYQPTRVGAKALPAVFYCCDGERTTGVVGGVASVSARLQRGVGLKRSEGAGLGDHHWESTMLVRKVMPHGDRKSASS
jgi:hypothetical protein